MHAGNPIDDVLPCTLLDEEDPNHEPDFNLGDVSNVEAVAEIFEDTSISSDALSYSEEGDHDRFNPGLSEEGPGEPSLLSISGILNVTAQADQPISEWRGERDLRNGDQEQPSSESTENEPLTESDVSLSGTPTKPIIYGDPPYPHQENEIQVKLEATKDMQGAAVTVEDTQYKDLTSLAPPPKPPDININRIFMHHHGPPVVQFPTTMLQNDYPSPIQEADLPLPSKFVMIMHTRDHIICAFFSYITTCWRHKPCSSTGRNFWPI